MSFLKLIKFSITGNVSLFILLISLSKSLLIFIVPLFNSSSFIVMSVSILPPDKFTVCISASSVFLVTISLEI